MKSPAEIRILVVEDDLIFQRVLNKRLSVDGYQVFLASDGREGMKAIVAHEPDLVISDWMMPHVDGLELCQSVKTGLREAAPYFILLTAKGEINDKLLALETGADDYIVKPCDLNELMARVRAGLRIVLLTQSLRRQPSEARGKSGDPTPSSRRLELPAAARVAGLCPGCRRVAAGDGTWTDPADWLRTGGLIGSVVEPCPTCRVGSRFAGRSGHSGTIPAPEIAQQPPGERAA